MRLTRWIRWCGLICWLAGAAVAQTATGVVFFDRNENGRRDPGEEGLPGVRVSNQRQVTVTDAAGVWRLPVDDDTTFFVIKPRHWRTPVNQDMLPQFYYTHKPAGSPATRFPGVAPTGPLPASIDFPLMPSEEPDRFTAIFFGDTQPRDLREVDYLTRDVFEGLVGTDAAFGVTLGDVVFDDLSVFEPLNRAVALIGIPWYNVIGNHDLNFDAATDKLSDETFERIYGPNYYSFEYGPTHFVVLDDVRWEIPEGKTRGGYRGGLDQQQLDWLAADLSYVADDQLVVLMMHIPITGVAQAEREALYRLIEQRPYCISVSGHTHTQEHIFLKREDGWLGPQEHHHCVTVTACGSWWTGAPDEYGIPHTMMRDGGPNGYMLFTFDGADYTMDYRAARRPANEQMRLSVPWSLPRAEVAGTPFWVNVYNGSERSTVEVRFNAGQWQAIDQVFEPDPAFVALFERDREVPAPYRPVRNQPARSTHLWRGALPEVTTGDLLRIDVRTTDMFGRTYELTRGVRIE